MPNPNLDALVAEVTETEGIIDSAIALIGGISQKIQDAVAAAIGNGATEAELAPLAALTADLDAKSKALSDAVAANS